MVLQPQSALRKAILFIPLMLHLSTLVEILTASLLSKTRLKLDKSVYKIFNLKNLKLIKKVDKTQ
jgi:hypothetical protein